MAPSTVTLLVLLVLLLQGGAQTPLSLLCRTDQSLRVRVNESLAAPEGRLQLQRRGQTTWTSAPASRVDASTATLTLSGLDADVEYRLRVSPPPENPPSAWLRTLPPHYVPGAATDVHVTQRRGADNASVDALVSWTPPEDLTCLYEVVLWSPALMRVQDRQIDLQTETPVVKFRSLRFHETYEVIVLSKSTNDSLESKVQVSFNVTDCLDWYNDTAICPPPAPVRLVAALRRRHKSVAVSWDVVAGRPPPAAFLVALTTARGQQVASRLLPPTARSATLEDVDLDVMAAAAERLLVTVRAQAAGGSAASSVVPRDVDDDEWSPTLPPYAFHLVLWLALGLVGAAGAAAVLLVRRRKLRGDTTLEPSPPPPPEADEWEISPDLLQLGQVLGEGAFGVVQRGRLGDAGDVAVKMLREDATPDDARQFRREMEMMKQVGPHPHVVSIVGCVTRDSPLRLVVEFCALGDLHNYLHKAHEAALHIAKGDGPQSRSLVVNHMYDLQQAGAVCLQAADLLSFARQIAMGMEFLASNHVLHRDLAARNVLVCDSRRVKISDFGLSRDVYEQNMYCTSGHGRLPVKWMALESLMHNVYTSQSDVSVPHSLV